MGCDRKEANQVLSSKILLLSWRDEEWVEKSIISDYRGQVVEPKGMLLALSL